MSDAATLDKPAAAPTGAAIGLNAGPSPAPPPRRLAAGA